MEATASSSAHEEKAIPTIITKESMQEVSRRVQKEQKSIRENITHFNPPVYGLEPSASEEIPGIPGGIIYRQKSAADYAFTQLGLQLKTQLIEQGRAFGESEETIREEILEVIQLRDPACVTILSKPREDRDLIVPLPQLPEDPVAVGQLLHDVITNLGKEKVLAEQPSGTTLTGSVTLVDEERKGITIVSAQMGDSRAMVVLINKNGSVSCVRLTPIHAYPDEEINPDLDITMAIALRPDIQRAQDAGGFFAPYKDQQGNIIDPKIRLNGDLVVTRALGHSAQYHKKDPVNMTGLSSEPEICSYQIPEETNLAFLIEATDGLTDVVDEQAIKEIVMQLLSDIQDEDFIDHLPQDDIQDEFLSVIPSLKELTHLSQEKEADIPFRLTEKLSGIIAEKNSTDDITFFIIPIIQNGKPNPDTQKCLFTVLDGHNGSKAVDYVASTLPERLQLSLMTEKDKSAEESHASLAYGDPEAVAPNAGASARSRRPPMLSKQIRFPWEDGVAISGKPSIGIEASEHPLRPKSR